MASIDTKQLTDLGKLIIGKSQEIIMWLATLLGNWTKIDPNNIYLILLIALSLFISRRIMLFVYASGEEGRTTMWLMIAGGIFLALKYL